MKVIKSPARLNKILRALRQEGKRIGFVPTMGCLHEGHLSLVHRARKENDVVAVSIFVNPIQFGPHEDFRRYPRNLKRDQKLLKHEHVDFLFAPSRSSIFPKDFHDFVNPGILARYLCGPKRPGHFRGVATVVKRLFQIVEPDTAYFGEKDYQQARVIEHMVRRFHLPIRIVTCPIVRERDGLAMSSRNAYLSRTERIRAVSLYRSLLQGGQLIRKGVRDIRKIKVVMREILQSQVTKIDYIKLVDPKTCAPMKRLRLPILIAIACFVGRTRLIDNLLVKR